MVVLGITGGIGSGKSFICALLEQSGVSVYYADTKAKELLTKNAELKKTIEWLLGNQAYESDGSLNREWIASRLFNPDNSEIYRCYSEAVHEAVQRDFACFCDERKVQGDKAVAIEAAILVESGFYKKVDYVVLVKADRELRLERAMRRDGVTAELIEQRMGCQLSDEERAKYAHFTVYNNNDSDIEGQINEILNKVLCQ